MNISHEKHSELIELIEDSVEYFCSKNMISGELVYTILNIYIYRSGEGRVGGKKERFGGAASL